MYMMEQADRIALQLERFTTGYDHHVVGQYANLDFWLGEVVHALEVLEAYPRRFAAMSDAQAAWIEEHQTTVGEYCPHCGGACRYTDQRQRPTPPARVASAERLEAQRRLRNATYFFLLRCYRLGLMDRARLEERCEQVNTSLDPTDIE
jgi:hypothetical protein